MTHFGDLAGTPDRLLRTHFFLPRLSPGRGLRRTPPRRKAGELGRARFYSENKNLPVTTVRIRNGKLSATAADGPVLGAASPNSRAASGGRNAEEQSRETRQEKPTDAHHLTMSVIEREPDPPRVLFPLSPADGSSPSRGVSGDDLKLRIAGYIPVWSLSSSNSWKPALFMAFLSSPAEAIATEWRVGPCRH